MYYFELIPSELVTIVVKYLLNLNVKFITLSMLLSISPVNNYLSNYNFWRNISIKKFSLIDVDSVISFDIDKKDSLYYLMIYSRLEKSYKDAVSSIYYSHWSLNISSNLSNITNFKLFNLDIDDEVEMYNEFLNGNVTNFKLYSKESLYKRINIDIIFYYADRRSYSTLIKTNENHLMNLVTHLFFNEFKIINY